MSQELTQEQSIEQLKPKTLAEGASAPEVDSTDTPTTEPGENEPEAEG
jgi:hypothetical protein